MQRKTYNITDNAIPVVCPQCGQKYNSYTAVCVHINKTHTENKLELISKARSEFNKKDEEPKRKAAEITITCNTNKTKPSTPLLARGEVRQQMQRIRQYQRVYGSFSCYMCRRNRIECCEFSISRNKYIICKECTYGILFGYNAGKEVLVNFEGSKRRH